MSTRTRIALVGATGLIGQEILQLSVGREDLRIVGVARREVPLPEGARMEVFVAEPAKWGEVFEAVRPDAVICALGTTIRKVGGDKQAFRAVDHDLVLDTARAAVDAGVERFLSVSSVGADRHSKNFYLSVKGETEADLTKVGFKRLDILRPGLLRGARNGDMRPAEKLGMLASPLVDLFLHGNARRYRSVRASQVAEAALALAMRKTQGRFVHDYDAIQRAARMLPAPLVED
ncbi:NAD(P)H-binding protein [Erythrobacter litoralis]|uniref:Nucleoside-diphosphate-sugar epimerase n=1 Tax=Erythrobacter litoralis (strain HTCC2594) TaxID=314225 RepID=Q2NCM2_ERYLH|nr:NAD(P)H-binding protein [Erythrobacter litoralis]ABC62569.1 nucleoside-diphosphate-sugar epimerase [Erythrobacter litoralis HTCC2594]